MAGTLSTSDQDIQRSLQSLSDHMSTMDKSMATATDISESIQHGYISDAGNVFRGQIEDWGNRCGTVRAMFQKLYDDLNQGVNVIKGVEQDNVQRGGSWGSDATFSALTPGA
jgi:hypothetical protein